MPSNITAVPFVGGRIIPSGLPTGISRLSSDEWTRFRGELLEALQSSAPSRKALLQRLFFLILIIVICILSFVINPFIVILLLVVLVLAVCNGIFDCALYSQTDNGQAVIDANECARNVCENWTRKKKNKIQFHLTGDGSEMQLLITESTVQDVEKKRIASSKGGSIIVNETDLEIGTFQAMADGADFLETGEIEAIKDFTSNETEFPCDSIVDLDCNEADMTEIEESRENHV